MLKQVTKQQRMESCHRSFLANCVDRIDQYSTGEFGAVGGCRSLVVPAVRTAPTHWFVRNEHAGEDLPSLSRISKKDEGDKSPRVEPYRLRRVSTSKDERQVRRVRIICVVPPPIRAQTSGDGGAKDPSARATRNARACNNPYAVQSHNPETADRTRSSSDRA
jgi:hypothetical protein